MLRKGSVHPYHTQVLLESLLRSPLLAGDLADSISFDRSNLCSDQAEWFDLKLNYQQKLGHLYEDALSFLIEKSSSLSLLGNSVQVFNENKITQGELDYLIEFEGRLIHLELAVKLYLAVEQNGKFSYPGPNSRDHWDKKLKRLESHQLTMSKSEFGRKLLVERYAAEEVKVQHLVYGKLFAHLSTFHTESSPPLPCGVLMNTEFHKWIYLSEWKDFFQDRAAYLVPKHLWPVASCQFDTALRDTLQEYSLAELTAMMQDYPSCTMVWMQELEGLIFLAPEYWP